MTPQFSTTYLRSPKIASRVFGWDSPGQLVRSVPRARFMFKAEFFPSDAANNMINSAPLNDPTDLRSVAFKVRTIDKPRVSLSAVELNHYNKKRLAYTKLEYNEATIRMYDTVDNSVLNLWINYFTYFFGDSRQKTSFEYTQSPVGTSYQDGTGWGFRPINENTNFFNTIRISALFGDTITSFQYINPKITSVDWQNKDYSVSDLEEVTISFKYEAIEYLKVGLPYKNDDAFNDGWVSTDTIDRNVLVGGKLTAFQPRLFSNQTATFNSLTNKTVISDPANEFIRITDYNTSTASTNILDNYTSGYAFPGGAKAIFGDIPQTSSAQPPAQTVPSSDSVKKAADGSGTWPPDSPLWAESGLPDRISSETTIDRSSTTTGDGTTRESSLTKLTSSVQGPNPYGEYKVTIVSRMNGKSYVTSYITKDPPDSEDTVVR